MIEFLGVGAQKSGTTWLARTLAQHPMVWMPLWKEVHYFDALYLKFGKRFQLKNMGKHFQRQADQYAGENDDAYVARLLDEAFSFSDDWYRLIFSRAPTHSIKGEITPNYSSLKEDAMAHIKRIAPGVKIIYQVRDPAERLASAAKQALARGSHQSIEDICQDRSILRRGNYAGCIPRWDKAMGTDSILYIPFGDIQSQPEGVIAEVETFLGLDHFAGYSGLSEKVFASDDYTLDARARELIREQTEAQHRFLQSRFGKDFTERTASH